jgi:hypothetical protein
VPGAGLDVSWPFTSWKKGKIRAKPDDLWPHQLDPFGQRRPHSLAWLVEVLKVESRHTKLRHVHHRCLPRRMDMK